MFWFTKSWHPFLFDLSSCRREPRHPETQNGTQARTKACPFLYLCFSVKVSADPNSDELIRPYGIFCLICWALSFSWHYQAGRSLKTRRPNGSEGSEGSVTAFFFPERKLDMFCFFWVISPGATVGSFLKGGLSIERSPLLVVPKIGGSPVRGCHPSQAHFLWVLTGDCSTLIGLKCPA